MLVPGILFFETHGLQGADNRFQYFADVFPEETEHADQRSEMYEHIERQDAAALNIEEFLSKDKMAGAADG